MIHFERHGWIGVAVASVVLTIAAWLLARWVLLRLPEDALSDDRIHRRGLRANMFGIVLVLLGTVLLFLPGPGLVLILAGVVSCDFPGRAPLLRWLLKSPRLLHEVNAMRRRHGRTPIRDRTSIRP